MFRRGQATLTPIYTRPNLAAWRQFRWLLTGPTATLPQHLEFYDWVHTGKSTKKVFARPFRLRARCIFLFDA